MKDNLVAEVIRKCAHSARPDFWPEIAFRAHSFSPRIVGQHSWSYLLPERSEKKRWGDGRAKRERSQLSVSKAARTIWTRLGWSLSDALRVLHASDAIQRPHEPRPLRAAVAKLQPASARWVYPNPTPRRIQGQRCIPRLRRWCCCQIRRQCSPPLQSCSRHFPRPVLDTAAA